MGFLTAKSESTADVYLRFSQLTQLYLKPLKGEYNLYESNGIYYLYLRVYLRNEGTEPVYYRSPILSLVRMNRLEGNQTLEKTAEVYLDVDNSTSAFYPAITYVLSGMGIIDINDYTPYEADLLINGIGIPVQLVPTSWPYSESIYLCYTCSDCQKLVDVLKGSPAVIYVQKDITIDKNPCISFTGDGNGLQVLCDGHKFTGSLAETAFLFSDAKNFYLKSCYVDNVDKALDINNSSSIHVTSIATSNSNYAVYLHNPTNINSYDIDLSDIMYGDQKLFFFRPGYGTSFSPFQPLAIWAAGFNTGISVDGGGTVLSHAYPLVAVLNSSDVNLTSFKLTTNQPYGIILINSNPVSISHAEVNVSSSMYGIYASNSYCSLNDVNVNSTAATDILLSSTDANLGDLVIK